VFLCNTGDCVGRVVALIFIHPHITTNKPESVGHIMAARVTLMAENAHIVDLIPLMSLEKGRGQIPVVNSENRLTGMVSQASLIWAMYNARPEFPKSQPR
jgi:CBS domain-containing membrane protein